MRFAARAIIGIVLLAPLAIGLLGCALEQRQATHTSLKDLASTKAATNFRITGQPAGSEPVAEGNAAPRELVRLGSAPGNKVVDLNDVDALREFNPAFNSFEKPPSISGRPKIVGGRSYDERSAIVRGQEFDEVKPSNLSVLRTANSADFDVVTVLWGTTRVIKPQPNSSQRIVAADFTKDRADELSTGYAKITIPKNAKRQVGQIPVPTDYTVLDYTVYKETEDPRKHFTVGELKVADYQSLESISKQISDKSQRFKGQAFVYVHGYWNTFEDSLFRTAQLAYDMGFDGVPILFSWPSAGEFSGYLYDKDSADFSEKAFLDFLRKISEEKHLTKIHIIAHSMGSRLLVNTLFPAIGPSRLSLLPKLNQVVLAAADVDASVMRARADQVKSSVRPLTLYACDSDGALIASRRFAGNEPRAGDVLNGKHLIMDGMETIDISAMSTVVFLGSNHSNYAEKAHVLKDLALLLQKGTHPPNVRFPVYATKTEQGGRYWSYVSN